MIKKLKEIRKDLFEAMEANDKILIGFGINRLDTLIHKLASDGVSADVRLACYKEVFEKFKEIEHESEFYGWLYAKAHEA